MTVQNLLKTELNFAVLLQAENTAAPANIPALIPSMENMAAPVIHPCSDSKYGRTVHLATKDNPRLINIPPRDSDEWKTAFNARTSAERSNKREKYDFLLENGRHRSSKMWYCRLYNIMMLQHLDAWDLPYKSTLRKLILEMA